MIYDNLSPIDREEFIRDYASGGEAAARALLRVALFESDQNWAEDQCLAALASADAQLRLAAVTSAGHLVRRFCTLRPAIVSALRRLREDGLLRGLVDDALEDVRIFAGQSED